MSETFPLICQSPSRAAPRPTQFTYNCSMRVCVCVSQRVECVRADDDASDVSATLVAKCRIKQRAWYIKSPWVLGHVKAKCWNTQNFSDGVWWLRNLARTKSWWEASALRLPGTGNVCAARVESVWWAPGHDRLTLSGRPPDYRKSSVKGMPWVGVFMLEKSKVQMLDKFNKLNLNLHNFL